MDERKKRGPLLKAWGEIMSDAGIPKKVPILCGLAAHLMLVCAALATEPPGADPVAFSIKKQPLSAALNEFARQSDREILFSSEVVKQKDAQAVDGRYGPEEALAILLAQTGLGYSVTDGETFLVTREGRSERQDTEDARSEPSDEEDTEVETIGPQSSQSGDADLQANPEEGDADEASLFELAAVTVTGSRLRTGISGSPMVVITREQIRRRGFSTVEDVVRSLTQNFSTINASVGLDNSLGSVDFQGQSAINLRGFGERSTLVLVNGRRWVQASAFGDGEVNINGIPFSAIERVEVLTSGASAIYGSDARAGVVNFILRKDYAGGETALRYDMGAHQGDSRRVEQSAAITWEGGRANLQLSYSESDSVDPRKAGFVSLDFRPLGGSDRRYQPGSPDHSGQPAIVAYATSYVTPGGTEYIIPVLPLGALPAGNDGTSGVFSSLSLDNLVPYDPAAIGYRATTPPTDRLSGHLAVDQEFLDGAVSAYAEFTFVYSDTLALTGVPKISAFVPSTNPYNDIPPHPFFSTSVTYTALAEVQAGILEPLKFDSDQNSRGLTLGLRAELPFRDWTGDFSATRGKEESFFAFVRIDEDLLAQRLAGVDAAGNPLPMDKIINPFGNGAGQSPAAMQGLVAPYYGDDPYGANWNFSRQDDFLFSANGGMFNLPAGESQLALGGEYRTEKIDYSDDGSRSRLFLVNKPERDISSFFGELSLPLVGDDNGRSGVHSLGLKLALRYDEYSFSGPFGGRGSADIEKTFDNVSPKVELAYFPMPSLKLRASWAESFVAPRISQLFGLGFGPINYYDIVDIENPEHGVQFPDAYFPGNPDLKPEISDTLAVGFDWTPEGVLDGLAFSVTWFETDFKDKVESAALLFFLAPELVFQYPGLVVRDAGGNIERLNIFDINLASRLSKTLDTSFTYEFDATRWGLFRVGAEGTFTDLLQQTWYPGAEPDIQSGRLDAPGRWKAIGYVGWTRDNATLNLAVNYSSSYAAPFGSAPQTRVENYMTFDLTGSYEFGNSGWKLYAGARNLTNRKFSFVNTNYGAPPWDPRRVDTRGRVLHLEVRKTYGLF